MIEINELQRDYIELAAYIAINRTLTNLDLKNIEKYAGYDAACQELADDIIDIIGRLTNGNKSI